jgi:hypothetical protein
MRSLRVQKRDTGIANIRTLVRQEISQSQSVSQLNSRSSSSGGLTTSLTTTPGTGSGGSSPVTVYAYNVSGSPNVLTIVTRSAVKPKGAVYLWDDVSNDRVELRYDALNDPLTFAL